MKKYEGLYRRIKNEIESGALKEGDRMLSLREEARISGLSANTVIAAYGLLCDEGLIRPRDRGGFYVCPGATELTREKDAGGAARSLHTTSREAGERLEQLYERLILIDPSFASAAPDLDILPGGELARLAGKTPGAWMRHSDPQGDYALRQRLALHYRGVDGPTAPEDLIITNGATEALSLIIHTLLKPGDLVALEAPVYFNYFRQLSQAGVAIVEIPMTRDGMDLALLKRELEERAVRLILVQPNVQNPTGVTTGEHHRRELLALAEKHGALLVQDDVFGDLSFAPLRPRNLSALSDYPGLLQISSFSKSLAPGLRIGWIRTPSRAGEFTEAKLRLSMESSRLSQAVLAGFAGTKSHRQHLARLRKALSERVDDHLSLLAGILPGGSFVRRPSGGCLLWIEFPRGTDASDLFERAASRGLIASPGAMFSSGEGYGNCLRLNTGHRLTEERARVLKQLGNYYPS